MNGRRSRPFQQAFYTKKTAKVKNFKSNPIEEKSQLLIYFNSVTSSMNKKTPQSFLLPFPSGVVFALHVPQEGSLLLWLLWLHLFTKEY